MEDREKLESLRHCLVMVLRLTALEAPNSVIEKHLEWCVTLLDDLLKIKPAL